MATLIKQVVHKVNGETQYIAQQWQFAENGAQVLSANMVGGYLFTVRIKASADDAVTVVVSDALGNLVNHTTTAAIAGEFATIGDRYTTNNTLTITLSAIASGTVDVEIVISKK